MTYIEPKYYVPSIKDQQEFLKKCCTYTGTIKLYLATASSGFTQTSILKLESRVNTYGI